MPQAKTLSFSLVIPAAWAPADPTPPRLQLEQPYFYKPWCSGEIWLDNSSQNHCLRVIFHSVFVLDSPQEL